VLLEGCPQAPKLPIFLKHFTWVDCREGREEEGFWRLVWGITGKKPKELSGLAHGHDSGSPQQDPPTAPIQTGAIQSDARYRI